MIKQFSIIPTCRWQCRTCFRIFELDVLPHDPKEPTSCPWGCDMQELYQSKTNRRKYGRRIKETFTKLTHPVCNRRSYRDRRKLDGLRIPGEERRKGNETIRRGYYYYFDQDRDFCGLNRRYKPSDGLQIPGWDLI